MRNSNNTPANANYDQIPRISPNLMREDAKNLIFELVFLKEKIDQICQPYQARIAEIEDQKRFAFWDLNEQQDAIQSTIQAKTLKFNIGSQSGGSLRTEIQTQSAIDREWLRKYYEEHPNSFLGKCVQLSEVASFIPQKRVVSPSLAIVFPMTYQQKIDRNQAILLARQLCQEGFALIDTETTGLSQLDEAVSIGIVTKKDEFYSLVRPTISIPPEAQAIHGISNADVAAAPPLGDVLPEIYRVINGLHLAAYNSKFDSKILQQTAVSRNIQLVQGDWTCAMEMFTDFSGLGKSCKLAEAANLLSLEVRNALHNSLFDARLAYRLVETIAEAELFEVNQPVWNEPEAEAEKIAYSRNRIGQLLDELSLIREQIRSTKAPFDARIKAITQEMKQAVLDPQTEFDDKMERAKGLVIALGQSVKTDQAMISYACHHKWDFDAIQQFVAGHPDDEFSQEVGKHGYGEVIQKVNIRKNLE